MTAQDAANLKAQQEFMASRWHGPERWYGERIIVMETASCAICHQPFERRANVSNPKKYCDSEKCSKIRKIKNSVAKFSELPEQKPTTYTADIQYHGRPNA
jgi:hypothetical protein